MSASIAAQGQSTRGWPVAVAGYLVVLENAWLGAVLPYDYRALSHNPLAAAVIMSADPRENQLLASLPKTELARWAPHLETVQMPLGQVLYESGATLDYVYFPTSAIVSLLFVLLDGGSAEIAVVGYEGIVGISLFMGGQSTPAARSYKVPAQVSG